MYMTLLTAGALLLVVAAVLRRKSDKLDSQLRWQMMQWRLQLSSS